MDVFKLITMKKFLIKWLRWETVPIATGKPTGVSHTCHPLIQTTFQEFSYERIHEKIKDYRQEKPVF